jgi:hypothetical protein
VLECMPSKHETLCSIPSTSNKREKKNIRMLKVKYLVNHQQRNRLVNIRGRTSKILLLYCSLIPVSGLLGGVLPLEPHLQPFGSHYFGMGTCFLPRSVWTVILLFYASHGGLKNFLPGLPWNLDLRW